MEQCLIKFDQRTVVRLVPAASNPLGTPNEAVPSPPPRLLLPPPLLPPLAPSLLSPSSFFLPPLPNDSVFL